MSEQNSPGPSDVDTVAARVRARSHSRHSDAYRWLWDHHGAVRDALTGKPSWTAVAEALADIGIRGARGQLIRGNDLRRIWRRVCRDVDASTARSTAPQPRTPQPRDLPATWTPPVAPPPPPTPIGAPWPGAKGSFAAVRREMERRSGR